jgi:hypothetical protein
MDALSWHHTPRVRQVVLGDVQSEALVKGYGRHRLPTSLSSRILGLGSDSIAMKQTKCFIFVFSIFAAILIQGCATDKALTVRNMETVSSVTAARYNCPQLVKKTAASQSIAMTGMMFGAIGGALGGAISSGMESSAGKKVAEQCGLPDFGTVVLDAFAERIPQDLPNWPEISLEPEPISKDHQVPSGYLLAVRINQFAQKHRRGS